MAHRLCYLLLLVNANSIYGNQDEVWTFPDGFLIGTATSSYQIEGAWNVSGKGENIWDRFTHSRPDKIRDGSNGDIAADSYHKYKEDVRLLKQLGVDFYRFSLSWSRILPTGHANVVSKDGIRYYNDLINELEKNNIKPFVTLFHWDTPQVIQDMGGWLNDDIVDLFGDYARVVFREFGDRVKLFATMNEPHETCKQGYFDGSMAPGLELGKYAEYLCTHNILKAHARTYHIYNNEFRALQNGKVGIVLNNGGYFYPKNKSDLISSEVAFQFQFGIYAHPIFSKYGDYPAIVKQRVAENSKFEGLERSRLPTFSKKWINYIRGTFDFMGYNHYTSSIVEPAPKPTNTIYWNDDGIIYSKDPKWPSTPSDWLKVVPQGFSDCLKKLKEEYGNPPIYITENGVSDTGTLKDDQRSQYLYSYIKAMLYAMKTFACNVKAYTAWSLIDNFEWAKGYSERFGLFHVDFSVPNRTRTPKNSVPWLTKIIHTRILEPPSNADSPGPSVIVN